MENRLRLVVLLIIFGSLTMIKILAVGISGRDQVLSLCAKLWLRLDIVPFVTNWKSSGVQQAYANALKVDKYFNAQSRSEFSSTIAHAAYLHCLPSLGWQYEVKVRRRLPPLPLPLIFFRWTLTKQYYSSWRTKRKPYRLRLGNKVRILFTSGDVNCF